jgi:acyl carrier protein
MDLEKLSIVLREIKPSLGDVAIESTAMLSEDLGLDSLDLLQLGRKIQRATGVEFVIVDVAEEHRTATGTPLTVAALLAAVERAAHA